MVSYIAIQNTYDIFEIALFTDNKLIDKVQEDKHYTSKLFIPLLEQLLSKNAVSFSELSFCAVNCGPGPFSTLRSIIASVNGLHAATNIPLIGIDGLEAIFLEFRDPAYENTVVLLNAFNNESYYLIVKQDIAYITIMTRLKSYPALVLNVLKDIFERARGQTFNTFRTSAKEIKIPDRPNGICYKIISTGYKNTELLQQEIAEQFPTDTTNIIDNKICSLETIARLGYEKFMTQGPSSDYLMPLHLKKHPVEH